MWVYVFGNKLLLFIVNYVLYKIVEVVLFLYGDDVRNFVQRNFYVDDVLIFLFIKEEVIDLFIRIKDVFMILGKIRLYKFVLNDGEVMKNLFLEDLVKDLKEINFNLESLFVQ